MFRAADCINFCSKHLSNNEMQLSVQIILNCVVPITTDCFIEGDNTELQSQHYY